MFSKITEHFKTILFNFVILIFPETIDVIYLKNFHKNCLVFTEGFFVGEMVTSTRPYLAENYQNVSGN